MGMNCELNKVTATLKVVVTGEFYDDEASEETLRYCVEQNIEDAGFDVNVELLKEQEPVRVGKKIKAGDVVLDFYPCGYCKNVIRKPWRYCPFCGREVKWDD